jgi:hypothetical protein
MVGEAEADGKGLGQAVKEVWGAQDKDFIDLADTVLSICRRNKELIKELMILSPCF